MLLKFSTTRVEYSKISSEKWAIFYYCYFVYIFSGILFWRILIPILKKVLKNFVDCWISSMKASKNRKRQVEMRRDSKSQGELKRNRKRQRETRTDSVSQKLLSLYVGLTLFIFYFIQSLLKCICTLFCAQNKK